MADEQKQIESTEQAEEPSTADPRSTPAFKAVIRQVAELRAAKEALEAKIAAETAERERATLESEGRYKEALDLATRKAQQEIEAAKAEKSALERELKSTTLRTRLLQAGVSDELVLDGIEARYWKSAPESVDEFVSDLLKSHPQIAQKPALPNPAGHGAPAGSPAKGATALERAKRARTATDFAAALTELAAQQHR